MKRMRSWKSYPSTYRSREVETLARWMRMGESGSILGPSGVGKSNLLGFLAHHPQALAAHFTPENDRPAVVQVDLNSLPAHDLSTFFRVILRSLYEAASQLSQVDAALPDLIEPIYRRTQAQLDPFLSQSAVREVLFAFQSREVRLVLVLDPFDAFCRQADTRMLDNLRGLRDSFKPTLSYIVGLRHELTYLRDPAELGELFELLDTHQLWLGPMAEADAVWALQQVAQPAGVTFAPEQVEELLRLTGGYPALLRAAALWLVDSWPGPVKGSWQSALQGQMSIHNRLKEIWDGLTGQEQALLTSFRPALMAATSRHRETFSIDVADWDRPTLVSLQAKRLLTAVGNGQGRLFCPLFAAYVGGLDGAAWGRIWHDPARGCFLHGEVELHHLSPKDSQLLHCFLSQQANKVLSIDELIQVAWADEDSGGITSQAVQQAIRHLRMQIEPDPASPVYLVTQHGRGYRFFPEGAPRA